MNSFSSATGVSRSEGSVKWGGTLTTRPGSVRAAWTMTSCPKRTRGSNPPTWVTWRKPFSIRVTMRAISSMWPASITEGRAAICEAPSAAPPPLRSAIRLPRASTRTSWENSPKRFLTTSRTSASYPDGPRASTSSLRRVAVSMEARIAGEGGLVKSDRTRLPGGRMCRKNNTFSSTAPRVCAKIPAQRSRHGQTTAARPEQT